MKNKIITFDFSSISDQALIEDATLNLDKNGEIKSATIKYQEPKISFSDEVLKDPEGKIMYEKLITIIYPKNEI